VEALDKYGPMLEDYWARAKKLAPILAADERMKLGQLERLFPDGELDIRAALGSLDSTRAALEKILSRVEADAPTILKKHLEEGAAFSETVGLVRLNENARVDVVFSAKNELPLGYGGEIALSSARLPSDFVVAESTGGAKVSGGLIRVSGVAEGSEYLLRGSYLEKTAEMASETETTESASERLAVKKIEAAFSSKRDAKVLVGRDFGFPARFSVSSDRLFSWSSSQSAGGSILSAVVDAKKGENRLTVRYSVDDPVGVREEATAVNNSVLFRVFFFNRFADLNGARLHFLREITCAEKVVIVGLDGTSSYGNGILQAEFPVQWFQKGETKTAEVRVSCASLDAAAAAAAQALPASLNYSQGSSAEEANKLKGAALDLLEKGLEPLAARDALRLADEALALSGSGDEAGAWKKVSEARGVLEKAADDAIGVIGKRGGKTAGLEALAALGKWAEFFGEANKTGAGLDAEESAVATELEGKKVLLSDYEKQRADAQGVVDGFSLAFWVPDEGGAVTARKKSLSFKEGEALVVKVEKAMKTLDGVWASSQSGGLEKYPQEFIGAGMGDLERAKDGLAEIVAQAKERAESELATAGERQKQFGTTETQKALDDAEEALAEGKFFYAQFVAAGTQEKFFAMTGEAVAAGGGFGGGGNGWYWLLGAFGLAALAGLAYVFSARKGKELKEL
jgi:hypothetical protein